MRSPTSARSSRPGRRSTSRRMPAGVTVYAPDAKAPLYPLAALGGIGEPAARRVAAGGPVDDRPRRRRRADGGVDVRRAEVRSERPAHLRGPAGASSPRSLAEVGELRAATRARARWRQPAASRAGGRRRRHGGWTTRYRAPLAAEDHNAQISLLTGMAAAELMLDAGTGILRTQEAPDEQCLRALPPPGRARSAPSGARAVAYGEFIRSLDPGEPRRRRAAAGGRRDRSRRPLRGLRRDPPRHRANGSTSRSPPTTRTRRRRCGACRTATSPSAASRRSAGHRPPTGSVTGLAASPT